MVLGEAGRRGPGGPISHSDLSVKRRCQQGVLSLLAGVPRITPWFWAHQPSGSPPSAVSPGALPGALARLFCFGEFDAPGGPGIASGPVAWLWLDASAPTTVVIQLQVLERIDDLGWGTGHARGNGAV